MRVQEILEALRVAVQKELPQGQQHFDHRLIIHTDRGGQFKSERHVAFTDQYRIQRSMTSGGCSHENPVAERINGIIKHELLEPTSFRNLEQAREAILGIDPTP